MRPPAALDGIPAPISRLVDPTAGPAAKLLVLQALDTDWVTGTGPSMLWSEDMDWYGPFGIGHATSRAEYEQYVLRPFREAFTSRQIGKFRQHFHY